MRFTMILGITALIANTNAQSPDPLPTRSQQPISHGELIPISDRRDLIWDRHRSRLYITTETGNLERFDAITRTMMDPWKVGDSLLGADITQNGQDLFVADALNIDDAPQVRKVNLDTGEVSTLTFPPATNEGRPWDIKIITDTKGFITTDFQGIGTVPLREFNITTGSFAIREDTPGSSVSKIRGKSILRRSADRSTVFILEADISSGPLITYDRTTDAFITNSNTGKGWNRLAAASPTGDALARMYWGAVEIRDRALELTNDVEDYRGGPIFDPSRPLLYIADENSGEIVAFETATYQERFRIQVGEAMFAPAGFDEGIMATAHDGSLLFLSTIMGVRLYELTGLRAERVEDFTDCMAGPDSPPSPLMPEIDVADCLRWFDINADGDVDLRDAASLILSFAAN